MFKFTFAICSLFFLILPAALAEATTQKGYITKGEKLALQDLCQSQVGEAIVAGNEHLDEKAVARLSQLGLSVAIEPSLNRFVLYKGNLLLACAAPQRILLANADVEIAANSLVYISDNGMGTCEILNLHDEHKKSVIVHVGTSSVDLEPARQIVLTSYTGAGFDDVNLCSGVRFRLSNEFLPVPTIKAFMAQYSLPSALQAVPLVMRLARSKTREGQKMLKTAAAVYAVSGYPADYRSGNN